MYLGQKEFKQNLCTNRLLNMKTLQEDKIPEALREVSFVINTEPLIFRWLFEVQKIAPLFGAVVHFCLKIIASTFKIKLSISV